MSDLNIVLYSAKHLYGQFTPLKIELRIIFFKEQNVYSTPLQSWKNY